MRCLKTVYRTQQTPARRGLIEQVCRIAETDCCLSGYIVFESDDLADYPNRNWRERALHMNPRWDRDIEGRNPRHLYRLMKMRDCEHLIWISRAYSVADTPKMLWVLAHELRHAIQDERFPGLHHLTNRLKAVTKGFFLELPAEADAENYAKTLVARVLGTDECQRYITRECNKARDYFTRLEELEAQSAENLLELTSQMLKSREPK